MGHTSFSQKLIYTIFHKSYKKAYIIIRELVLGIEKNILPYLHGEYCLIPENLTCILFSSA